MLGDQGKSWGPRIVCKPCIEHYTDGQSTPDKA